MHNLEVTTPSVDPLFTNLTAQQLKEVATNEVPQDKVSRFIVEVNSATIVQDIEGDFL